MLFPDRFFYDLARDHPVLSVLFLVWGAGLAVLVLYLLISG